VARTIDERFNLRGKVAVVVGGAGHLGSTLARAMVESGMQVVVLDVVDKVEGLEAMRCDVTSRDEFVRCRETILARHGRVDVLLNAAGTNAPTPFFEIGAAEIERILSVHLIGTLYSCQVFGEVMVKQRRGSIINFASASMGPPLSKAFVYSTAKAAIANLTQNLGREWGPVNVRVNALRPGFFPTEWSMQHFIDKEREAKILGHTPMGRYGQPEELVGAVLWLASDAASFVTGSIVTIDGGFTGMTI
jgi:NAD(P)-dependent dehydrogenase (short-subunit alcohol dehydrogenase family)